MNLNELQSLLDYSPETGVFVWKVDPKRGKKVAGKVAGSVSGNGYLQIKMLGKVYLQHRLAYFYQYGNEPNGEIDHINGDKKDNRIINLRNVSASFNKQNCHATKSKAPNALLGVSFCKRRLKYTTSILVDGINKHIGQFATAEEAHAAYIKAKAALHPGFVSRDYS